MIRFAAMFLVLALAVLSAETYTLDIYQPVFLGGKELKTGEYRLDVQGDHMTIKKGNLAFESKVKVETLAEKARTTALICDKVGDKLELSAIQLKGTTTKLVVQ